MPEELDDDPVVADDADDVVIEDVDELGEDQIDVEEVIDVETDDDRG